MGLALGALVVPSPAFADTTPAGPATLVNQWRGASTLEGRGPEVLVAATITVGAGGQAGTIRLRAGGGGTYAAGDSVTLPAEPGTYRFPAPHLRWDYRSGELGFDQEIGGHAVLEQRACNPAAGRYGDWCEIQRVNVWGTGGDALEPLRGARLAIIGIFEPDADQDLVGDTTEDRTDLKLGAAEHTRGPDGTLRVAVPVTNAGPRTADLLRISTTVSDAKVEGCSPMATIRYPDSVQCTLASPIAPGTTRTVRLTATDPAAEKATLTVRGEGPDLDDADNAIAVDAPAATPLTVTARKAQRLRPGVKVRVSGIRDSRARVTVAFRLGGKTIKLSKVVALRAGKEREVTLKPTGPELRSLRRLAGSRPLPASVTVRSLNGRHQANVHTTVRA